MSQSLDLAACPQQAATSPYPLKTTRRRHVTRSRQLWGVVLAVPLALLASPVLGWPQVVRVSAVLLGALALALIALGAWRWRAADIEAVDRWTPSPRLVAVTAAAGGIVLFWVVLTRFWSGEINAVDFTVYFDRPCFQTTQGRPLFIESADDPQLGYQGQLAQHAYWGLFLVCAPYFALASPMWLHLLSVVAPVVGAVYILRLTLRLGLGGVLSSATALAFLVNDNTARTLNYGFHPEVLYAWLLPWMLDAGFRGARTSYLLAAFGCLLVKEDAVLALAAVATTVGLYRWRGLRRLDRWCFLALPVAAGAANLAVYYLVVLPRLSAWPPLHLGFWDGFGTTPLGAVAGMAAAPTAVLAGVVASGIWTTVLLPHLFLPLAAWRWTIGAMPIVLLFGASSSEQIRTFSLYYAIVLVPFLVLAASHAALNVTTRLLPKAAHARLAAAALVAVGALLVGVGNRGYSLRAWRPEIPAITDALQRVAFEERVFLQSSLYPHAGYDARFKLLAPHALTDPANVGAAVLLAPALGVFPFADRELERHQALRVTERLPGGLVLSRIVR